MGLKLSYKQALRELSFLKLGTGVEEFLEGYQIFLPRFIGVSNILEKIVRYLMGCEILEYISDLSKNYVFFHNKSFICFCYVQERSYLK